MAIYVRDSIYTIFSVDKGGALGNSKGWYYYLTAHSPRAQHGVGVMDGTEYTYSVTGKFTDSNKTPVLQGKYWIVHCVDRSNWKYSFQPWLIRKNNKTSGARCLCLYNTQSKADNPQATSVSNGTYIDCRSNHSEGYGTCKWIINDGSVSNAKIKNDDKGCWIRRSSTLYNEDPITSNNSSGHGWIFDECATQSGVASLQYSITLNGNGGIWTPTQAGGTENIGTWGPMNVFYGTTNNGFKHAPSRTGYTLNGMYTQATGGSKIYKTGGNNNQYLYTVDNTVYWTTNFKNYSYGGTAWPLGSWRYLGDATFYAQWTENSYNITYNLGGGSFSRAYNSTADNGNYTYIWNPTVMPYTNSAYTVNSGKSRNEFFQVEQPARPGYTFKGWTITGMDSTTHHYWIGSQQSSTATSWDTSTWSNLSPAMRYLRATAGTVTFTAQWELDTNVWVKVGETWKHGKAWIKVGDTWKLANRFGINANGTWKDGI